MNPAEQVLQYHIRIGRDVPLGKYCLLPGDPGRCAAIAAHFDDPVHQTTNREYCTWTGTLLGQPVSVCSTGIGGPSAVIALEELTQLGVTTFLRVGTCGGIRTDVQSGDVVIATGAIRMEGTSREYAPIEYPAVSDFQVTTALVQAAQKLGKPFHTGVVQCKDSFYGQHDPFACYQKGTAQLRMIHGELDSTASPVIARQFAEEKGAEFLLFPGAEHRLMESGNPERALQLAIEFFKQ